MTQQPEFTPRRGSVSSHYEAPKEVEAERLEELQWTWQWGALVIGSIVVIVAVALLADWHLVKTP